MGSGSSLVGEEARPRIWEVVSGGLVKVLLQPVVELPGGRIVGYEALSRGPEGTPLESPEALYGLGRKQSLLFSLERLCRRKALLAKSRFFPSGLYLFLNVDPQVVYEARHQADITREVVVSLGLRPEEIVLELTERTAIPDYESFVRALELYRRHGFLIALDDVGSGHSNLRSIVEIKPHFLKVDMSLVRGINEDGAKRAVVEAVAALAEKINARVIAEGVESLEELRTLYSVGVRMAQGYFLARPEETPPSLHPQARAAMADLVR